MLIFLALLPSPISTDFCLHLRNRLKVLVSLLSQNSTVYPACAELTDNCSMHGNSIWSQKTKTWLYLMVPGRFKIHTHNNTSMTWGEEVAQFVKDLYLANMRTCVQSSGRTWWGGGWVEWHTKAIPVLGRDRGVSLGLSNWLNSNLACLWASGQ